jgi:transposase InsO family protein
VAGPSPQTSANVPQGMEINVQHQRLLHELCGRPEQAPAALSRRGLTRQRARRRWEQQVRDQAVRLSGYLQEQGWLRPQRATVLGLCPRTLRHWEGWLVRGGLPLGVLGRPTARSSRQQRNEVIALLDELGPGLGVPTLRECFPQMTRAELADLLRRYRRLWCRRHGLVLHELHWLQVGAVWAMDYTQAPQPIDGCYAYLLAVRDLASGMQLLWLPQEEAAATQVLEALAGLFRVHGVPLVLKTDNGCTFIAEATRACLSLHAVEALYSPPYRPGYNGSIEAGIGALKMRTEQEASRQGRAGQWTYQDVAAAQAQANATSRPRGLSGPSAEQLWQGRRRVTASERERFQECLGRVGAEEDVPEGQAMDEVRSAREQRGIRRSVLSRALVECGYLFYKRRRIPPPIRRRKVTRLS